MSYTNTKTKIEPFLRNRKNSNNNNNSNIIVSLLLRVDHALLIVFLLSRMRAISASIPLFLPHALLSRVIENTVDVTLVC